MRAGRVLARRAAMVATRVPPECARDVPQRHGPGRTVAIDGHATAPCRDERDVRPPHHRPFPEAEERARISAAFDRFLATIRDGGDLAKALALLAA